MIPTADRARGRWGEILPVLGVAPAFLRNRHGPCPICGGKDRFRYDDKNGDGTYFCNQCGPGTGIILLRRLHGWDHATACKAVDEIIGKEYQPKKALRTDEAPSSARNARAIEDLLRGATDRAVVESYLQRRGLAVTSDVLRGHTKCAYFEGDPPRLAGHFRAVVAPIIAADGKLESVQRIYDADLEPQKKSSRLGAPSRGPRSACMGMTTSSASPRALRRRWRRISSSGCRSGRRSAPTTCGRSSRPPSCVASTSSLTTTPTSPGRPQPLSWRGGCARGRTLSRSS
jgi:hypothetical protein